MIKQEITIQGSDGLKVGLVALVIQVASKYTCEIHVESDNKKINAKSLMGMMALGPYVGKKVLVLADGADEEEAIADMEKVLSNK